MKNISTFNRECHSIDNANFANKIALFGGSFDPPHLAHLEIIKWLSTHFRQVIVIPAYQNPLKDSALVPLKIRLKWCQKMCANFSNVLVSDIEARHNKVMFAYELARHFYAEFFTQNPTNATTPNNDSSNVAKSSNANLASLKDSLLLDIELPLYFVIGEDCLRELHKWNNITNLSQLVEFIVFKRDKKNEVDFRKIADFVRVCFVDFSPNDCLKTSLELLPNGNLSSSFLREAFLQESSHKDLLTNSLASNQANHTQNHKQILEFIPECLHNEVLAFFAKTSLQFD